MIYTELTKKAMRIAYDAHHGQVDKSGQPYVFHPYHLAEQMEDEITVCAALLHDVVEDTEVTFEELEREFPAEIINVLKLLTHDDDEDYFEYVKRIKTNPAAKKIKLADIEHNSDQNRLEGCEGVTEEKKKWWQYKYARAKEILMEE